MKNIIFKHWFLAVCLLLAVGCKKDDEKAKAETATIARKVPVECVEVVTQDIRDTLVSTAAVDSRRAVDVVAEVPGVITSLDVEQGDTVKAGQRLAKVHREELNLGVQSASSAVGRLEREVKRLEGLRAKGVISQQSVDEATYRLEEARAEQRRARVAAGDTRVTSSMDGVVALRSVNLGQQVATGTPLFRIVDPSELVVHVNLPENALSKVYEAQPAYLESEALGNLRFDGVVERISPVVDPRTGTIRVTIAVKSETESDEAAASAEEKSPPRIALRPGMFVKTFIVTQERPAALVVPRRAVTYQDDQAMVFVVDNGVALRKRIVTGVAEAAVIEVREGLEVGAQVIVLGQDGLKDGTPVDAELRKVDSK